MTASAPGLTTGLIVRTYYLTCQSVKTSPIRVLRWQYPPSAPEASQAPEPPGLLPNPTPPARYHVGYTLASQGRVPDWMPRHVVDDGKKLYSVYSEVTLFGTAPLLRMLGPNGPQLVNARPYLNVVIVDQLLATAELRVGTGERAETVTITRGALRTIDCPGDAACPVWPQAATTLRGGGHERDVYQPARVAVCDARTAGACSYAGARQWFSAGRRRPLAVAHPGAAPHDRAHGQRRLAALAQADAGVPGAGTHAHPGRGAGPCRGSDRD